MRSVGEDEHGQHHGIRQRTSSSHELIEANIESLVLLNVDGPQDELLSRFYSLYSRIFTLEEEREPIEGFARVLSLNNVSSVQKEFGPLRERVTVAVDPLNSRVVGAANYVLYAFDENFHSRYGYASSSQLNFLCVDPEFRGVGVAGRLLSALYDEVEAFGRAHCGGRDSSAFVTCEQNNPARMTPKQLEEDLAAAGIDPYDRMRWWQRRGYRRLLFDYCQPALNPESQPCRYIDFFARFQGADANGREVLPSALLVEHLRRFFFVSVGKFEQDMDKEPNWLRQRDELRDMAFVNVDRS